MHQPAWLQLKQKYPNALYTYFRIANLPQAMAAFLTTPTQNPQFTYPPLLEKLDTMDLSQQLANDLATQTEPTAQALLTTRQQEVTILTYFQRLQAGDAQALAGYRQAMVDRYGGLQPEYFHGIISHAVAVAKRQGRQAQLQPVLSRLHWRPQPLFQPQATTFWHYSRLAKRHHPAMFSKLTDYQQPQGPIERALHNTGLWQEGWRIKPVRHGANILVSYNRKQLFVSQELQPRSSLRLNQLIAHEVYGHARRWQFGSVKASSLEEEGLAVVLEQLLMKRFWYKRTIRYLAIGLAWGVDGTPRDFAATYRLLLPVVQILTRQPPLAAAQTAFKECARAFRGGHPAIPGAVLIKDKIYLEGNLAIWQALEKRLLSDQEFGQILDGHATMLRENHETSHIDR